MPVDRRKMLAGLAGFPLAGAALPLLQTPAAADPFIRYGADVLALQAAIEGCSDEQAAPFFERWGEVDAAALSKRPTTLAGAVGALEYARREFVQFDMDGDEDDGDHGHRLTLHLIDGAIAVLRQAVEGGARA